MTISTILWVGMHGQLSRITDNAFTDVMIRPNSVPWSSLFGVSRLALSFTVVLLLFIVQLQTLDSFPERADTSFAQMILRACLRVLEGTRFKHSRSSIAIIVIIVLADSY